MHSRRADGTSRRTASNSAGRSADNSTIRNPANNYYSRSSRHYAAVKKRSLLPIIVAIVIALLAIAALAIFVLPNLLSPATTNEQLSTAETSILQTSEPEQSVTIAEDVLMTLSGDQDTYVLRGEEYLEAGCKAIDADADPADITSSIVISGNVDTTTAGDYTVTYTATTAAGEIATKERYVHVVDSFEETATSVPVLMYHYVYTASDVPDDLNNNYILDTDLEAQLAYLHDNNYYYPSYQELNAWITGAHTLPAKSVVLTFDDGQWGVLKYGGPLFEKYEVPVTSFVICSDSDAVWKVVNEGNEYINFQSHSYGMHMAGSDVGQGGIIHAMTTDEIYDDLVKSSEVLGNFVAFAYPFGDNNENAQAALSEFGVLCAFTVNNDRTYVGDNPLTLSRVRISGNYTLESFEYLVAPNAA